MSTYLIGDVHGCYDELIALLKQVDFTPGQDTLWLTGDLVARGPGSLDVLRYVKSLGDSVRMVLGNHDLHLLAVYAGISRNKPKDRITPLLEAPDADELLNWLRRQPLLQVDEEKKLVMAHAGITPQWDLETAQQCARDVEAVLSSDSYPFFLDAMYGDMPNHWSNELSGLARQIVAFQNGFPSTIHLLGGELSLRRGVHEKLALFDKRVARCDRRYRLVRSLLLASTVQLQRDSARFFISILQLSFDILELRLNINTLLIASISKRILHYLIELFYGLVSLFDEQQRIVKYRNVSLLGLIIAIEVHASRTQQAGAHHHDHRKHDQPSQFVNCITI